MGLIHRRLNGIPIPEQLPPELVPPSARDLEGSVSFLKDLLKDETRSCSPSSIDSPVSRLKDRSFNGSGSTLSTGRDATIYKYNDSEPAGGFYQPRSRHVNRSDVRTRDDQSPASNLSDLTRRLQNTAKLLDRSVEADATRTSEDDALDREMADLEYRAKRLQDDIEYVSHGPSSEAKNEERRRLERELVDLLHHRLPEVAKKIEAREERREKEKREWRHQRDRANERSGRFDYGDDRDRYSSRRVEEEREMNRSRGAYDYGRDRERDDRGRDYDRGSYRRDSPVDRYKDRDAEVSRTRTPPAQTRSPPPPPPVTTSALSVPPSTSSRSTPSPAPTRNMTPAERQEFARNEAKRRIQARMQALGISSPSTAASPTVDTSVEERLAEERKEAEEKARIAEEKAAEREQLRRERLENEKALKEGKVTPSPAPPTPTPTSTAAPPRPTPTHKPTPPQPKPRAPAPPPPRKTAARPPPAPVASVVPPAPRPPAPPVVSTVDPEEEALRAREEALRKQREARAERIRQLEREEEEARLEEERFKARIAAAKATPVASPAVVSPPVVIAPPPPPAPPAPPSPAPPSPAPPIPPSVTPRSAVASAVSTPSGASKTNPFRKEGGAPSPATLPPTNASNTNPFFRPQTAPPASVPTPPKTPTPVPVKTTYHTAPGDSDGEDWDAVKEYDDNEDSSDDEITKSRDTRAKIAESLFGSGGGGGISRPSSTPATSAATAPRISSPAQVPTAPPPPPAPAPPVAPQAPTISPPSAAPSGPGDVSALLKSIQGGAKLRSVQTVDKSLPIVLGKILGDDAPPAHINASPRPASPPALPETSSMIPVTDGGSSRSTNSNRQSVDWYAGLAADQGRGVDRLPSTTEEDEDEEVATQQPASIPQIFVDLPVDSPRDPLADIDKTVGKYILACMDSTDEEEQSIEFEPYILTPEMAAMT